MLVRETLLKSALNTLLSFLITCGCEFVALTKSIEHTAR